MKDSVYEFLCLFAFGKDNAIHMDELAEAFNTTPRKLRETINQINDDNHLEHMVKKGDASGYYIIDDITDIRHMRNRELQRIRESAKRIKKLNHQLKEHKQVVWNDEDCIIKNKYKGELKWIMKISKIT